MTKPAEIAGMVADAETAFGSVDILVKQRRHPVRRAGGGVPGREVGQIIAINCPPPPRIARPCRQ